MTKEIEIPEGHEAKIIGNKVILKPKESEDERIRKGLIHHLEELREWKVGTMSPIKVKEHYDAWIAYLKKQRESAWTEEDDEFERIILPRILNPHGWTLDQNEADKRYLKEFINRQKNKYLKKQKERGILSKDEEYTLARIIEYLEDNDCPSEWKDLLHDVYSLPYQKEQQPAEWSEKDEKIVADFLYGINVGFTQNAAKDRAKDILDILRPQLKVELTLLDENIINAAIAFVEQNDHFNGWRGIDKRIVIKALRTLKPHWKPSKEQMEAILDAMTFATGNTLIYLNSLYEQLEAL